MKNWLTNRFSLFATVVAFALCLGAPAIFATGTNAPLRVTSWNFAPRPSDDPETHTDAFIKKLTVKGAESLKKLDPDVILLQEVASQEQCRDLVEALKPTVYHLVICSSFWDARAEKPSPRQVAILSKLPAQQAWAEPWQTKGFPAAPDGLAFAAVQIGSHTIGFFTLQIGDNSLVITNVNEFVSPEEERQQTALIDQLAHKIDSLRHLSSNSITSLVLAGDFNANENAARLFRWKMVPRLKHSGFAHAFPGREHDKMGRPNAADCIMIANLGEAANPQVTTSALARMRPASCDLDLDSIPAVIAPAVVATNSEPKAAIVHAITPAPSAVSPVTAPPVLSPALAVAKPVTIARVIVPPARDNNTLITLAVAGFVVVVLLGLIVARLMRPRVSTNQSMVVANSSALSRAEQHQAINVGVMGWLKERFVRRLITDRSQLIRVQDAATEKMLAVDERLASVERHIQAQNQDYERRIAVLQQELSTAKEENRELIKAQIALLQMEMAKTQTRSRAPLN